MSSFKHILVVANQTVGGDAADRRGQGAGSGEPTRVTVICPQNDPSDAWVVNEQEVAAETRERLSHTLEALREAGIEATGRVVDRDPYTAVLDVVESSDPPAEIIISTLPQTRSGWLRRDLVERLRDRTKLPIEHIVVDVEPGRAGRT